MSAAGATALRELAPGKVNRSLLVGPPRPDGRHELVTVIDALELADVLTLEPLADGDGDGDEVVCPGVEGENLALRALRAFRAATGWDGPPQRLTIAKRVPVAAGMGGGSSDAAAALRLARRASGGLGDDALLLELGAALGSDVPALLAPGSVLVTGGGERVRPVAPLGYTLLVVPSHARLSTGAVYAEADRLGLARPTLEPEAGREPPAWVNDLQDAARSLCPAVDAALDAVRAAGAPVAVVSGSGPTVCGVFPGPPGPSAAAAERARDALLTAGWGGPDPIVARPLG